MVTENKRLKSAYDTAANWTSGNPTLLPGEIGIESDTKNVKVGDGSTSWNSLDYSSIGVTARNTTTGRLAIGGIEIGDTGWRNIASSLINSWTGTPLLRRSGNIVTLEFSDGANTSTTNPPFVVPSGFRPGKSLSYAVLAGTSTHTIGILTTGVITLFSAQAALRWHITWITSDAWPTTLPGTAA